ncbi:hypothetical protein [Sphingobacterium siyangense]|uniref:hypothetical protein n=1 Tax=Sphingobacterium siyangense TaxID=459529 RepID=UPI003DA41EB6
MSLEHLHYTLKEIDTVSQLLLIENATFFKRSLTRLIAMRTDDFIKLGFIANKQTVRSQSIKDDLNALKSLYEDYFKKQRDKYGAHVQHLDFGDRLKFWSEIDADKASFFTELPRQIFSGFHAAATYISYTPGTIDRESAELIKAVNKQFNLELFPSISTDILALTRPNTGGMINLTLIHTKAGVLKSLELLIDYEIAQIEALKTKVETKRLFLKLFITDLVSYLDNYFTRTDIAADAAQYEEGFDYCIRQSIDEGTANARIILTQFVTNVNLTQHINELRNIRNRACGHIDPDLAIDDLDQLINEFDVQKFKGFYLRLKDVFRSICHSVVYLKQYLIDPLEPIHGIVAMTSLEVTSFDGQPFEQIPGRSRSINDEAEYEEQFKLWTANGSEAARSYFWKCFIYAEEKEDIQIEIEHSSGGGTFHYHQYRKVHQFFENKLRSPVVTAEEKISVLNLFVSCRSGDPETLAYILGRTYPSEFELQCTYITAIGKLSKVRSTDILQFCKEIYMKGNLPARCFALTAILRIDIRSRRSNTGQYDTEANSYSEFIKEVIIHNGSPFEQLSISLALLSDLFYGGHLNGNSLDTLYRTFLENEFLTARKKMVQSYTKEPDTRELKDIELLKVNRFVTLVAIFSDFLEEMGDMNVLELRNLVAREYIMGSRTDNHELHNLAVLFYKTGDLLNAISVARFLTEKNAQILDHNYLLLDLYRSDQVYKEDFDLLKKTLLQTFILSDENRARLEAIEMDC